MLAAPGEGKREEVDRRVQEAERRARQAEDRAQQLQREKATAESQAQQFQQEKATAENQAQQFQREKATAEIRAQQLQREKATAEDRAQQLQREKATAERRSEVFELRSREAEDRARQLETQWVVEREEIQLTEQELGRGGWATVSVALFRGVRVAAKCIHRQIASPRNIQLFKREMDMAARIRHPNLLQFIGASLEGQLVILTELMPTSLRRVLERELHYYMGPEQAIPIGLDVIRALNYLHLFRPQPLIHRDISSANVLLEPLPACGWRAKVSDYGTVNLQEKLETICPGNACYAAPEATDPRQQSPKMDIFSFGVVLMEMLTGEFPASDERGRLLSMIHHQPLLALIQNCLSQRKEDRPTASDIIARLET